MKIIQKYFKGLSKEQLIQFTKLEVLYKDWNSKINVISRKDIDELYLRHVLHSLSIAKLISFKDGTSILDVGTGGGFPGIPLAILFPNCKFHLVALGVHDMNGLKCPSDTPHMGETYSVLQTAATWLGMNGVTELVTCGIDPEGGYHPMFEHKYLGERHNQKSVWTPEMAKVTEDKFHNIARQYNYTVYRLMDDGTALQSS